MTYEEMMEGLFWVNEKFPLIIKQDDHLVDIDWILEKAKLAVLRLTRSLRDVCFFHGRFEGLEFEDS